MSSEYEVPKHDCSDCPTIKMDDGRSKLACGSCEKRSHCEIRRVMKARWLREHSPIKDTPEAIENLVTGAEECANNGRFW